MSDATTTHRQHDPALCPSWCSRDHLEQAVVDGGFHHDADSWSLLPGSDGSDVDSYTVALLTPDEAAQLGLALLAAAAKAQQ